MAKQKQFLPVILEGLDLTRFIEFRPNPFQPRYQVAGCGRRAGDVGICLGTLDVRHAGGNGAVLLQFDDGKIDAFHPHNLFPVMAA